MMKQQPKRLLEPLPNVQFGIETDKALDIVQKYMLGKNAGKRLENKVKNMEEYDKAYRSNLSYREYERLLGDFCREMPDKELRYRGYCEVCESTAHFLVDFRNSEYNQDKEEIPNWRESIVCPSCQCNNRMRFVISKVKSEYKKGMDVLLYENNSIVHEMLCGFIPDLEAVDILDLNPSHFPYADETFDLIVANDVFQYVEDYRTAFKESQRILKEHGKLILMIPFNPNEYLTQLMNWSNPYQIYGWDILDILRAAGFKDACGKNYYDVHKGYLGYLPIYFEAVKNNINDEESQVLKYNKFRTESELKKEIDEHKIISFDIFDTLIMRKTLYPEDVFDILASKALKYGLKLDDFKEIRIKAQLENGLNNPNLYEIYESFQSLTGITDKEKNILLKLEIETEKQVIIVRLKMLELFNYALNAGKEVYLISDMYIPKDILEEIINPLGIIGYKDIIVSCDYRQLKCKGLYNTFKTKAKGKSCLHIGDNNINDGIYAEKCGIDSFLIYSAIDLVKETSYCNILEVLTTQNDNSLLGLSISIIFNSPFAEIDKDKKPKISNLENIAYIFLAPLITRFMFWLLDTLEGKDYDKILFAARDGFLIKKLYDIMSTILGKTVPLGIYFQTSRKASVEATVDREEMVNMLIEISNNMKPEEILCKRFGLNKLEILPYDEGLYANIYEYVWAHQERIFKRSIRAKWNYFMYMKNIKLSIGEKYAFYDFVSSGTTQKSLQSISPFILEGVYCGWNGKQPKEIKVESLYENADSYFINNYKFMEIFMTSIEPSLNGFRENGEPVLAEEKRSENLLIYIESVHQAIIEYFESYLKILYIEQQEIHKDIGMHMYALMQESAMELPDDVRNEIVLTDDWGGQCEIVYK